VGVIIDIFDALAGAGGLIWAKALLLKSTLVTMKAAATNVWGRA
jgi:hypothetical protein